MIAPNYEYHDEEGVAEALTLFQWYRSEIKNDPTGAYAALPATGPTYTLGSDDFDYHFKVLVTPVATDGTITGEPVWFGPSPNVSTQG